MADLDQIASHREDYSIVWLDPLIDPEDLHTQELATKLSDTCKVFADIVECLNHIRMTLDPTILIISGSCAEQCLNSFRSIPSIDSIVIYCAKPEKYSWIDVYGKVVTCVQTEADLIEYVHRLMTLKCQKSFHLIKRTKNDAATFIWFRLMFDCLIAVSRETDAKEKMIQSCRMLYRHNRAELAKIEEFEKTYCSEDAIRWYTGGSFIYRKVNQALRTENINKVSLFGSFIYDLYIRLAQDYCSSSIEAYESDIFTVYRGMRMSSSELNILRNSTEALVITNCFMSTSKNRDVATAFIPRSVAETLVAVLFEIEIDLFATKNACFAEISRFSCFPEEEEILFNIGSTFRINSVEYDVETELWLVLMSLVATKEYLDIPELPRLCEFESLDQNQLDRNLCTSRLKNPFHAYYNYGRTKVYRPGWIALDDRNVQGSSSVVLSDVDNYVKALLFYEQEQFRHTVSVNCACDCNCYGNNNISKDVLEKVNDSSKTTFSINEKTEPSDEFHYLKFALDYKNDVTNMNTNHLRRYFSSDTGNFSCQQEKYESVPYAFNYLRMSTRNTSREFFVENPILCFDIRKDRLNREKKALAQAFFGFQTMFVTDVSQIIEIAARCQVNNHQLYFISSESLVTELKSFEMKMIRIYYLNNEFQRLTCDEWDGVGPNEIYVDTIEQLTSRLYHDLARFYSKAAEQVASKDKHSMIIKHLLLKSTRCYELLAQNTRNIIQRYQDSLI